MPDERADRARTITSHFIEDLNGLDSPDSYKQFVLRYFSDTDAKEFCFNIVAMADLSGRRLNEWIAFKRYFLWKAHQQFAKRTSQLKDLDAELGFMSR
jgi:hypothetical protein